MFGQPYGTEAAEIAFRTLSSHGCCLWHKTHGAGLVAGELEHFPTGKLMEAVTYLAPGL